MIIVFGFVFLVGLVARKKHQVIDPIIHRIVVDVMYDLAAIQAPPDTLGHDKTMFHYIAVFAGHFSEFWRAFYIADLAAVPSLTRMLAALPEIVLGTFRPIFQSLFMGWRIFCKTLGNYSLHFSGLPIILALFATKMAFILSFPGFWLEKFYSAEFAYCIGNSGLDTRTFWSSRRFSARSNPRLQFRTFVTILAARWARAAFPTLYIIKAPLKHKYRAAIFAFSVIYCARSNHKPIIS